MTRLRSALPFVLLFALLLPTLRCHTGEAPALVLYNGIVYTVDPAFTVAEAVALRDGRIAGVGRSEEILRRFGAAGAIDLEGRTVVPGFIDAHAHLESLGSTLASVDLRGCGSVAEIRSRVGAHVAETPSGAWLRGRGWDQNLWPGGAFPTRGELDPLSGDVPVYLTRIDGHAVWVNTAALTIAGVTAATPDPPGGRIVRDASGEPTGVFVDNAVTLLSSRLPPASRVERKAAVARAVRECLSHGLTQVHDMGVDTEGVGIYREMIAEGEFPFRVYVALDAPGETWDTFRAAGPDRGTPGGRLTVRAVKLYADGALGSRGAALLEPYSDDPGNRGLAVTPADSLGALVEEAIAAGFQVCTHAIGDRANRSVLDAYERALRSAPADGKALRFRVEHAQVVSPQDIPRFARLGVIPSMQPTHCTSDMPWAEARLGPERVRGAYAWRSLLATGVVIPGGSDFPVERPPPLHGFYAAVTRTDHRGDPRGGWYPGEAMTREEALKSFTLWAAWSAFQEDEKGSIEPGKLADLVVLSRDIMHAAPRDLLTTTVEATIVGGKVEYAAQHFPVR
jgi:predicted amidohydrolase YtcJ